MKGVGRAYPISSAGRRLIASSRRPVALQPFKKVMSAIHLHEVHLHNENSMRRDVLELHKVQYWTVRDLNSKAYWFATLAAVAVGGLRLCVLASTKPFWYDEILTLTIANQSPGPAMWKAMTAGFEFNPPFAYVISWAIHTIAPPGELISRLPQILACLVSMLVLYRIVATRSNRATGFLAVLLSWSTLIPHYGVELRAYAFVVLGTTLLWSVWGDFGRGMTPTKWRYLAVYGALELILLSHVWGLLVVGAFGVAEIFRWISAGRIDAKMAAVFLTAGLTCLCYLPLVKSMSLMVLDSPIYRAGFTGLISAYIQLLLFPLLYFVLVCLLLFSLFQARTRESGDQESICLSSLLAPWEIVLSIALMSTPVLLFLASEVSRSHFYPRYCLSAIIPMLIIVPLLASMPGLRFGTQFRVVLIAGFVMFAWALMSISHRTGSLGYILPVDDSVTKGSVPMVVSDGIHFLKTAYYTDPGSKNPLLFVGDSKLSIRYTGTNGIDAALLAAAPYLRTQGKVVLFQDFVGVTEAFEVAVSKENDRGWILKHAESLGAEIKQIGQDEHFVLYAVALPDGDLVRGRARKGVGQLTPHWSANESKRVTLATKSPRP